MESQNHFYGHSAALAAYLGLPRPRHIRGLVQHGWTAVSPVATHFRDFPAVGLSDAGPRLFVWSHESRGYRRQDDRHHTTPIGAQLCYLVRAGAATHPARDERDEVVLMPVHGIQTQRVRGDHDGLAQQWREAEGPATACLYAVDAADPLIRGAYERAGHRVVVLGERTDGTFIWRLATLLGRARRVVSNRLSTPVVYAGHLGKDIGVYGDALQLDGEASHANDRVRDLWPELHAEHVPVDVARSLCDRELGVAALRSPQELSELLGWDRPTLVPAAQHWTSSPVQRALVNIRRRSAAAPAAPATPSPGAESALSPWAWFVAALSYLPDRLPRSIPDARQPVDPIIVSGHASG